MITPVVEFPPVTVSTDHETALLVVPVTVAVNCMVAPAATLAEDCPRATLTAAGGVGAGAGDVGCVGEVGAGVRDAML